MVKSSTAFLWGAGLTLGGLAVYKMIDPTSQIFNHLAVGSQIHNKLTKMINELARENQALRKVIPDNYQLRETNKSLQTRISELSAMHTVPQYSAPGSMPQYFTPNDMNMNQMRHVQDKKSNNIANRQQYFSAMLPSNMKPGVATRQKYFGHMGAVNPYTGYSAFPMESMRFVQNKRSNNIANRQAYFGTMGRQQVFGLNGTKTQSMTGQLYSMA